MKANGIEEIARQEARFGQPAHPLLRGVEPIIWAGCRFRKWDPEVLKPAVQARNVLFKRSWGTRISLTKLLEYVCHFGTAGFRVVLQDSPFECLVPEALQTIFRIVVDLADGVSQNVHSAEATELGPKVALVVVEDCVAARTYGP